MDQKRHQITKLYSNDAILVYEGNKIKSSKEIGDFYGKMPSSSHRVTTLDAQPISQKMLNGISSVLVSGNDSFDYRSIFQLPKSSKIWSIFPYSKNELFQSFWYSQMEYLRWGSTSSQSIYPGKFYNIEKKVCQATLSSILEIIVNSLIKSITAHDFINDRLELVDSIGHCSPM